MTRRKSKRQEVTPAAHQFNRVQEDWENAVVETASYFSVCLYEGMEREYIRSNYRTFREAHSVAVQAPRSLIYAVTELGRSTCIPKDRWTRYLGGEPVTETVLISHACKGCHRVKGARLIGDAYWHPSCWRTAHLK